MDIKNPFATGFNLAVRKRRAFRGRIEDRFRFAKTLSSITEGEKPIPSVTVRDESSSQSPKAKEKRRAHHRKIDDWSSFAKIPPLDFSPSASAKPIEKR